MATTTTRSREDQIRDAVRERYAAAARSVKASGTTSCCSDSTCCSDSGCGDTASTLYDLEQIRDLPEGATQASLGCGNPTLLAALKPGETVLDLGSGGGIDVLLSAKRVGPTGKAYGLDMTDEMLELARGNARQAGVSNVEFLKGQIEAIPLPDESVDVIISNCVINLSADKAAVLREAFRVLRPGGRFAVADIVVQGAPLPPAVTRLLALWVGCLAGAITEDDYRGKLESAGFSSVEFQVLQTYDLTDVPDELRSTLPKALGLDPDTKVVSAFIRATKPNGSGR